MQNLEEIPFKITTMTFDQGIDYKFALLKVVDDWFDYFKTNWKNFHCRQKEDDWMFIADDIKSVLESTWSKENAVDIYLLTLDKIQGIAFCHQRNEDGKTYYYLSQILTAPDNLFANGVKGVGTALLASIVNYMKKHEVLKQSELRLVAGYLASSVGQFYRKRMFLGMGGGQYRLTPDRFDTFLQKYSPPIDSTLSPVVNNTTYAKSADTFNKLSCIYRSKIEMESNELIIRFLSAFFNPENFPSGYVLKNCMIKDLLHYLVTFHSKENWGELTLNLFTKGEIHEHERKYFFKSHASALVPIFDNCRINELQSICCSIGLSELYILQTVYGADKHNDKALKNAPISIAKLYCIIIVGIDDYLKEENKHKNEFFFSGSGIKIAESYLKIFNNKNLSDNFKIATFDALFTHMSRFGLEKYIHQFISPEVYLCISSKANKYAKEINMLYLKADLIAIINQWQDINLETILEEDLINVLNINSQKCTIF